MSFLKSDFFVQFRVFYNKEFTRQKKSYKQIIHICTVCSNRQARRERAVGEMEFGWLCVDVVVYVYRRIYFVFFEILRIRGLSMFRFACFCLLDVSHFLHYFTFSPIYDFSYEKFLFFFLILFLNKK